MDNKFETRQNILKTCWHLFTMTLIEWQNEQKYLQP